MGKQRHWQFGAVLIAGAIAATGCARQAPGTAGSWPPVVRTAARAVLLGNAYDRALKAQDDENYTALASAYGDLIALGAQDKVPPRAIAVIADNDVVEGELADMEAEQSTGLLRAQARARAGRWYAQARTLLPHYDSENPELLNGLGYHLADQGTSQADFLEAERLTRLAVQRYDSRINALEKSIPPVVPWANPLNSVPRLKYIRAITRDSLAWALYRQGRYPEAATEQEAAVKEAVANVQPGDGSLGDLHFHLGEIYRALNRVTDARREYQECLKLKPTHEGAQRSLAALPASSATPAPVTPSPTATPIPSVTPSPAVAPSTTHLQA